jgi:carbon monoxide dehydrogenase subunit G
LRNLESIRDRIPEDQIQNFSFDADSVSAEAPMMGKISVQIVDREEPKCVKFGSQQSPMPFNVWVQVLPVEEQTSKLKVTVDADIPFMLKGMVSGPLQQGVEKIAEVLAGLNYGD